MQEEADEASKDLYAKRSAAVVAAFNACGAEAPSRVVPLELEGAFVSEEGLKVVLEVRKCSADSHFLPCLQASLLPGMSFSFYTRAVLNPVKEFIAEVLGKEAKHHLMQPSMMAQALSDIQSCEDARWRFLLLVFWMFLGFTVRNLSAVEGALCSIASAPELHSSSYVFSQKGNTTVLYVHLCFARILVFLHFTSIKSILPGGSTTRLYFNNVFPQSVSASSYTRR